MKIQNSHIIIVFLLGFLKATSVCAQEKDIKDILDRAGKFYMEQPQFKVDMTFTMYRGFYGKNVTERYQGIMQKKGDFIKNTMLNTLVYQFPKAKIIVDEDGKTLTYTPTDTGQALKTPIDLGVFLEYYQQSQVLDQGNKWVCEMVAERTTIGTIPYGKVVLHISKEDYHIMRQELFFSQRVPFKSKNGSGTEQDFGRLVIDLVHHRNAALETRNLSDFIAVSNSKELQLQGDYANYRLIDRTTQ
ncbi:hypothetical protein [Ulvibacterium marinum]|uniref:hypothetical protein n=1 Tax=Ulvibacterium marinum TaxID=2419782 RepID=UPI002495A0E9|nr:hypothetical protein [Ulvibacterium marinum]